MAEYHKKRRILDRAIKEQKEISVLNLNETEESFLRIIVIRPLSVFNDRGVVKFHAIDRNSNSSICVSFRDAMSSLYAGRIDRNYLSGSLEFQPS